MLIIVEFQLYARKVIVLAVSRERCVFHVDRMWTSTRGVGLMMSSCRPGGVSKTGCLVDLING